MSLPPPDSDYSLPVHILRALARRFPHVHRAINRVRAWATHLRARAALGRLRRIPQTARAVRQAVRGQLARRRHDVVTVGVDIAAFWEPLTGIGWYLYRLLEHLADREDVKVRLYGPTSVWSPDLEPPVVELPRGQALELVERRVPDELVVPRSWVIRILRRLEPLLIAADGNDVLFAPNFFLPRRLRIARGAQVATIHDLGLHKVPWTLRDETMDDLKNQLDRQVRVAKRLITVSGAVRDELVQLGYTDASRVTVIHHGPGQLATVDPGSLLEGIPDRFGLHVGTLEPRKNITVLIDAWRQALELLPDCPPLVICGRYGWKSDDIRSAVEQAEKEGWVLHPGYVDDTELAALYRQAEVVVFPTLYEGFGLPAIEALWAETPLVCSDLPVLRETTGGAALFASPDRAEEFARHIVSVLSDPEVCNRLAASGRARVGELSWDLAADTTVGVWMAAAGDRRRGVPAKEAE